MQKPSNFIRFIAPQGDDLDEVAVLPDQIESINPYGEIDTPEGKRPVVILGLRSRAAFKVIGTIDSVLDAMNNHAELWNEFYDFNSAKYKVGPQQSIPLSDEGQEPLPL